MKFGLVARVTLALALLVVAVFTLQVFFYEPAAIEPEQLAVKQKVDIAQKTPDFSAIRDVKARKQAFFDFIRPGIISANRDIALQRQQLLDLQSSLANGSRWQQLDSAQLQQLEDIAIKFKYTAALTTDAALAQLLVRVDTIPKALVMVQAANESGWGTSRFARLGLNFFGQWCFSKGCGLVPISRSKSASHEVRVFDSVDASIASYLSNLNTHPAYEELRQIRSHLRQNNLPVKAEFLAPGLINYSERQQDYVAELLQMLRHNKAYL